MRMNDPLCVIGGLASIFLIFSWAERPPPNHESLALMRALTITDVVLPECTLILPEPVVISMSGVPDTVSVRLNDPVASNAIADWLMAQIRIAKNKRSLFAFIFSSIY